MANITKLRRTWKFAAICQFLFTFEDAFGMKGFKTEVSWRRHRLVRIHRRKANRALSIPLTQTLEHDLAAATFEHVPDLMRRLLYTLTLDAKVT